MLPIWVDLTGNAGLTADGRYICQNIGLLQIGTELRFWARINNDDHAGQSGRLVISAIA